MKSCEKFRPRLKKSRATPICCDPKLWMALTSMLIAGCATLSGQASSSLPAPTAKVSPDVCGVLPPLTTQEKSFLRAEDLFVDSMMHAKVSRIHYSQRLEILRLRLMILSGRGALGDADALRRLELVREVKAALAAALGSGSSQVRRDAADQTLSLGDDLSALGGVETAD